MTVAVIFERFGPYHHARLAACAQTGDVTGIEIARQDTTYAWAQVAAKEAYPFVRLADDLFVGAAEIDRRLQASLDDLRPDVVAIPGWAPHYAHSAIVWAMRNAARVVVTSDSNRFDARRNPLLERSKRAILSHASAGFAAGQDARDYLVDLGLDPARIVLGYDVVDNAHFDRPDLIPATGRRGFLAIGRFVGRKNFPRLLQAYARYRDLRPADPWPLTLAGDGADRAALQTQAAHLGLADHVSFPGFVDYADLPGLYAAAGAFVLPSMVDQWGLVVNEAMAAGLPVMVSRHCGCARDLVQHNYNGRVFDPHAVEDLALGMYWVSQDTERTCQMGQASRDIIANWSLQRFAKALYTAADLALAAPAPRPGMIDAAVFDGLRKLAARRAPARRR